MFFNGKSSIRLSRATIGKFILYGLDRSSIHRQFSYPNIPESDVRILHGNFEENQIF